MKTNLPVCFILAFAGINSLHGQITGPAVKANFGIEADVSSNFYNNTPQPAVDDWFSNNHPGTGQFIIDTTGAAAILSGYTSMPASRRRSFSRLMRQAPFSIVNNRILLDAVYHRDYHGDDSTIFASGSNKNGMSPASWSCPVAQSIPDKNDILDAFTHVRRAGPNLSDSAWLFGGVVIENTTGSRYFDFELYQTDISYNRSTRTFQNFGPDAGHTSWTFDAAGNIVQAGDIIFTAEFSSASLTKIEARIWINKGSLSITPAGFNWGGQFDGDGSGATFGYASIVPKTAGAFYTGLVNAVATWSGSFALVRDNDNVVSTYAANQFMEFSVNLSKLGIDPSRFGSNPCGNPFRRVLIKTRSSTSFTAELKDFVAPFRMFDFAQADLITPSAYFCEMMPATTISVSNPISTSVYQWSTANGHIVGASTGTSITVNAPGTYYVNQMLHPSCPVYATDSVTIFFDSVCTVLPVQFIHTKASHRNGQVNIQWEVDHNESAERYTVEWSINNQQFSAIQDLPATTDNGRKTYGISAPVPSAAADNIYYRVRATGSHGQSWLSRTVQLSTDQPQAPVIYPNPAGAESRLTWFSKSAGLSRLTVIDAKGQNLFNSTVQVYRGLNNMSATFLQRFPAGMYIISMQIDGKWHRIRIIKK